MPVSVKVAGLLLLVAVSFHSRTDAQVPDSAGAARPGVVRDSATGIDTAVAEPRAEIVPIDGVGSIAGTGVSLLTLPESDLPYIPFRSAGDLLPRFGPHLGSLFVSETGLGGVRRKYSVHGLSAGSVSFLSDGVSLNDPSTGLYPLELYPADFAGSIEFAGPPASAVNFVSRSARAPRPVSRIRYTQSSYGSSLLDGSLWQDVARGFNVSIGLQHPVSDGRFANSGLDAWKARVKLRYDLPGASVYASDLFTRRERGLNDGVSPATPDSLRFEPIRALVNNASATEMLVRHDLMAGVAIGRDDGALTTFDLHLTSQYRQYRDEAGGAGSTGVPFRETRDEQSYGFRLAHSREIAGARLALSADLRNRRLLGDPNIGSRRSTHSGISGSVAAPVGHALTVTPFARLERFLDRGRLSPGADLRLEIVPGLAVVGGVSRSHRFPSFAEAFGVRSLALPLATPDPERHDLISGGLIAGDSSGSRISIVAFHRKVAGTIVLDSAGPSAGPPLAWGRGGGESRSGISASAGLRLGSFLAEWSADYLSYGGSVSRRHAPAWNIAAGIYLNDHLVGGHLRLKAGFRGRYFSAYDGESLSQRFDLFLPAGSRIAPAGTVDFVLFAGIGDAVIHLIWENLLDRQYVMTTFYPMDDRTFRFGLTWEFLD